MITPQEKKLMMTFLHRSYPIRRIKHKMRFKRMIVAEGREYQISDKVEANMLYTKLMYNLAHIFNTPEDINKDVLKTFLYWM